MFDAILKKSLLKSNSFSLNYWIIGFTIAYSFLIPWFLSVSPYPKHTLLLILLTPILTFIIWDLNFLFIILIGSTFTRLTIQDQYLNIIFVPILTFAYIIHKLYNTRINKTPKIYSPLIFPFLLCIIFMIPSLIHIVNKALWFYQAIINLIGMIIVVYILSNFISNYQQIKTLAITFLVFTFLNGIAVFIQSHLSGGGRVFGFMGVYYIDFVNIAILIVLPSIFFLKGIQKVLFIPLLIFYFISLLLTQTRNSLLSLIITCSFFFLFLLFNNKKVKIPKAIIIKNSFFFLILISLLSLTLFLITPQTFERFIELFNGGKETTGTDLVSNSLVSRLLIWHTALNAFIHHPFVGIGLYNFKFISSFYHTIPNDLYKQFVWHLTPHLTYIAILAETGLIGFIGFITFLFSIIRMCFIAFYKSKNQNQTQLSLALLVMQIYVISSMLFTDAWLWGQCGMLWCIILGISIANYKIILRENLNAFK